MSGGTAEHICISFVGIVKAISNPRTISCDLIFNASMTHGMEFLTFFNVRAWLLQSVGFGLKVSGFFSQRGCTGDGLVFLFFFFPLACALPVFV